MNAPALPAHLAGRQSRGLATALSQNLGTGSPPYVSIKGNRFTLVDLTGAQEPVETYDPKTGSYIDCVIIDVNEHTSKIYFDPKKPYDPAAEGVPPICWSDNGIGPSRNAASPQSATCGICPNNVWGSATSKVSGKGVKACHDVQKIAVLIPGDDVIFLMRIPPNSRTNLRDYTLKFQGGSVDISDVVTRVAFDQQTLGTLVFSATSYIDAPTADQRDKVWADKTTDALVGRTDVPIAGLAALAQQPSLATPAQLAQQALPVLTAQVQQSAPFVAPAVGVPSQTSATPATAAASTASPSEQPPRRRRRTAAQMAEGQQAAPAGVAIAPGQPGGGPAASSNFGIQTGTAPNPELEKTLNSLFGPG